MTLNIQWLTFGMRLLTFFICVLVSGCFVAQEPENAKTVAAFDLPPFSEEDRSEFISLLRQVAALEGMHVNVDTKERMRKRFEWSDSDMTIYATVCRSSNDQCEVFVSDQGELGYVLIKFAKGKNIERATRFREHTMREIRLRWPEVLSIPIVRDGTIVPWYDRLRTPDGYIINPAAASKYSSPQT